MSLRIFQVDAFADTAFTGNPAAVCLLEPEKMSADKRYDDQWMQALAEEMNVSEMAFVQKNENGSYQLRWFTPTTEVNLCGHATLATAHTLWTETDLPMDSAAIFHTLSGCLEVRQHNGLITMNFPTDKIISLENDEILKQNLTDILSCEFLSIHKTNEDILVELANEKRVKTLQPNMAKLAKLPIRCLIVTAHSSNEHLDFVSRVFGPAVGIDEDPVTGSAHCSLTPFWAEKLQKQTLSARQISARGGNLTLQLLGDRVNISGTAITVFKGEFT